MSEKEKTQEFLVSILERLNRKIEGLEVIREILTFVREFTGLEAVAIRLHEGEDYPYFSSIGFPESFVEAEKYLCPKEKKVYDEHGLPLLECMCGNVIRGRTDPKSPFFTVNGSFCTNSTSELLASTTEKERQSATRNRCNSDGYESVALIPLKSEGITIGLLQLNDRKKGCFTPEFIRFMERVGNSIGIALYRSRSEDILKEKEKLQGVIETAGAVCHEMNQPIMTVSGYSEMILADMPEDNPFFSDIRMIKEEIGRMEKMTKKLKEITKYETMEYIGGRKIINIDKSSGGI
ncbi:MAG: GAF domain-containing protein [Desulfobacterales bacterium]|nr:GAF domain-containing protein [Desulfobacterales bacterium]